METETLFKDALAGIFSAKLELRKIAQRLSRHDRTILHIASKDGSLEQVRYILKEFADNNILMKLDSNQETALHLAAFYGHTEVVKLLIEAAQCLLPASGDVSFETFVRQPNTSRNTALHLAVANGSLGCARLLVEADKEDRHIPNCQGEPPVYLAAKLGYNKIVKMICETCTAPSLSGPDDGSTALHAAIKMLPRAKTEDRDVVEVLIGAVRRSISSSNIEAFVRQSDANEETALHLAVQGKHLDVVRLILEVDRRYPHEDRNKDLKSPIYIAAEQGSKSIVKLLCGTSEFGYTTLGPEDETALHAAILGSNAECVRSVLDRAPYLVSYVDKKGGHRCIMQHFINLIRYLRV
ncbi:ankyrin repeat-containing protein ITN1-like [Daucus carota subsp. sativus]|uniref:ankyrin repeat-containing protein ITN1-like n=1 Tax=Daucus carota subsp. sativus TaxID=79200 RepID=UPI0007EFF0AC|nr:PREDICTED: ankyrin repeat-containing protein At3g12360-like isoform X2 [Daucus carota subsp. sativus]